MTQIDVVNERTDSRGRSARDEVAELRSKLAAAEKTVRVLKTKVHALMSGAEKSIIEKQLIQSQKRSEAIAKKREMSDLRTAELERHSAQLEGEVRARTRAIRTILDHVTFGFLLMDATGRIQPGSTRSCRALFGSDDLDGRSLADVLGLDARASADWSLGITQVFDDLLPEDVSVAQLRTRFAIGERILRIEARAVRHDGGAIEHLLLSVTDVSRQEAAELDARRAHALVDILRQRDAFERFVWDARERLDAALGARDAATVRGAIHTIKGNAACFGLFDVASVAHQVEDEGVDAGAISRAGIERVESSLHAFLRANRAVLGIDLDGPHAHGAVLAPAQLEKLVQLSSGGPVALQELVTSIMRRPAIELLGPVDRLVDRIARQLGKDVRFRVDGGDVLVDAAHQDVFSVMGHLVRNAVDHGIDEAGHVRISITERDDAWRVCVEDDGRGIDDDAIARAALTRRLCSETEIAAMSRDEKLRLIFVDGLSTKTQTSDISGRGVGMSAVLQAATNARGELRVRSEPGQGTSVEVVLPKTRRPS